MNKGLLKRVALWLATMMVAFLILFPVLWIFSSSITDVNQLYSMPVRYFPDQPTLANYQTLIGAMDIGRMALNTLWIALCSILLTLLLAFVAGYGFARSQSFGKQAAYSMLVFSAMLPVVITLVPMSRMMIALHLNDTLLGLIILYSSTFLPFSTMIFTNAIKDVPEAIDEAAEVDGAGLMRRLFTIILPLLKPVVATMAIIIFIWSLNEFITPLIFAGQNAMTLSVGLSMMPRVNEYSLPWEKISALSTIIMIPIVLFVTVFQRQIMDGLMAGGVKQ